MYIVKKKTKEGLVYYLCKSYRDATTGKNSSKLVERIGSRAELEKEHEDVDTWLKSYAKERSKQKPSYKIDFNPNKRLSNSTKSYYNAGYFVLKKICYRLGIDKIINEIAEQENFKGDLSKIFLAMVYDHIIFTDQENSLIPFSHGLLENINIDGKTILQAIKIFSDHDEEIQGKMYLNANKYLKYDCSIIFNECSNFCFDINQRETSSINLVQVDVFSDKNGLPLTYFNNSKKRNNSQLKQGIIDSLKNLDSKLVCFSDNIPSKVAREIAEETDCSFAQNVNIKILKNYLQEWILDKNGWSAYGNDKIFSLEEIENIAFGHNVSAVERGKIENIVFYKMCKVNKGNTEKNLIVGYNLLAKKEDRNIRNTRYEQIKEKIDKQLIEKYEKNPEEFDEFFTKIRKLLADDIIEDDFVYEFNNEVIDKDIVFDGFYACLVDADVNDAKNLIHVRFFSWLIDYMFQTMKREFRIIPKKMKKEDCINAHLLISYTSLLVSRILFKLIKGKYRSEHIRDVMAEYDFIKVPGIGWIPSFSPNRITNDLDKICGIDLNYEIIPHEKMKEYIQILKQ